MDDDDFDRPNRQIDVVQLELGKVFCFFDKTKQLIIEAVKDNTREDSSSWILCREIGKGAFGTVYHVVNETTKQEAALKAEIISAGDNLLRIEREIMNVMKNEPNGIHVYDEGIYEDYRFIVMTLCGPDLEKVACLMNNNFSPVTIIRICIRSLLAIKTLHECEYIHRDLKPCNFALDYLPTSHQVYLFDYGMGRRYARNHGGIWRLRRAREQSQFRGTTRYCSINMHDRKELGRVDDIWSWIYMLMDMHSPLPWANTNHPDRAEMGKKKFFDDYVEKNQFLKSFVPIINKLKIWKYEDRPDYSFIFTILYKKLKELNGKLTGPNEYDEKINAFQLEQERNAVHKVEMSTKKKENLQKSENEDRTYQKLLKVFEEVRIPGGKEFLLREDQDFFVLSNWKKNEEEEKKEVQHVTKNPSNAAKKMRGMNVKQVAESTNVMGTSKNCAPKTKHKQKK